MFGVMGIVMRTGSSAAIGEISKLMNVYAVFWIGIEAFYRAGDGCGRVDVFLGERD